MVYNVVNGEIAKDMLYHVAGAQSVIYDSVTYNTGQYFRGGNIKTFAYTGAGSQELYEASEIRGGALEYVPVSDDQPVYTASSILKGFSVEYELNEAEKIVNEVTGMQGFALELIDYPLYSFSITEKRL